jgi:phosphotransferase system HPr-like phosphotransfer protein
METLNIMRKYTIQLNYNASIIVEATGNDEGEALDNARNMAEEADIKEFTICGERESQILRQD